MSRISAGWIGKRVLGTLLTVLVASIVIYGALRVVPGDPLLAATGGRRLTPDQLEAMRHATGLDKDFVSGYLSWISGIVRGDLGDSLVYGTAVTGLIGSRLAVSGFLIGYSTLLAVVLGLAMALLSALKGGLVNRTAAVVASVTTATPPFVAAIGLLAVFTTGLGWFPATGAGSGFVDRIWHLTLPAVAMALAVFGVLARVANAGFVQELERDHVEVARSRGVPLKKIVPRHVVRNALPPLITMIGLVVASLFVGTAVVETAFGIDGIGSLLVRAVTTRDFPVVQGVALIAVTLFVVINTLVDLAMPFIDPRVAQGGPTA